MASQQATTGPDHRLTLLIVDDEPHILEFLQMGFSYEGFDVLVAASGAEALRLADEHEIDLAILDVMMPGMSGIDVARQLHQTGGTAIIMLTARSDVDDKVVGLEAGADDYVSKPFAFKELLARVRAVLRRHGKNTDRVLAFQDVAMDRETRQVTRGDRVIELTPREFDLLELFLMHPRQVLTRGAILAQIWGYAYDGDDNVIEVFVRHLREKLQDNPPRLIQTVRGVGYCLRG
jgi:DNA-binding response OmpR family regulator